MKKTTCNPIETIINKLKEKEIHTTKGGNIRPIVFLDDAIDALEELEILVIACCEAEMLKKHMLNQEDY